MVLGIIIAGMSTIGGLVLPVVAPIIGLLG